MQTLIRSFVTAALRARFITLIATALILLAGVLAFRLLSIEAYPELANPQVRVITLYPGKGAEEVEQLVTVPLEKEINGIPGQTALRSISLYGLSIVIVTFSDVTQTALARQHVLERINGADLPEDAQVSLEPDVGSLREIYRYTLSSQYYDAMGLRTIQEWELEKLFRQIPGVIDVISQGGPTKTYQVNVDPEKLRSFGLTLKDVDEAISASNATTGGGFLEESGKAIIVRQIGWIKSLDDVRNVVVSTSAKGTPITVGDLAEVEIGPRVRRGQVGRDYQSDAVQGIVLLRRGENPSKVLAAVKEKLPSIISRLPAGVDLNPLYDRSKLINQTLVTVSTNMATGIALVILFLTLFLRDLKAAVITAVVIPASMLVAFITLSILGVPANLLSLGAIDFGILVDAAVVMTENIVRRLSREGRDMSPSERMLLLAQSAREVSAPIVFGILSIITTFLPIFAFSGVEGKLFRPLATTMVAALIGSGLAAITLVPVLCSFLLVRKPVSEKRSPLVTLASALYRPTLKWSLRRPWIVITASTAAVAFTIFLFSRLGAEFLPHLEEGTIWLRANVKPSSVTLAKSVAVADEIRRSLLEFPEVTQVLSQTGGPDDGTDPQSFADHEHFVDLLPKHHWRKEFKEDKSLLIESMRKELEKIPGVSFYFTQYIQTTVDEALSGVQGSLVAKVVGQDLVELERLAHDVGSVMRKTPGIVDVIVDPIIGQPQLMIEIDRAAAARYGLNVEELKDFTETAIGGKPCTTVMEGERRFQLYLRFAEPFRAKKRQLHDVLIDTPSGAKIPLSQFAKVHEVTGASQIWRDSNSRMATIRANVRGRDLASAVDETQKLVSSETEIPTGYSVLWSGEFQRQKEAASKLTIVIPVTLMVILTILYIASGTLRGALVMFSVVPLSCIGAVLILYLTGTYFSISAGVGFICLFGLAVQNSILLVSFINELMLEGMSVQKAIYRGALIRMRPVLMTASIAAVGLLPAALSNEIGAQTQRPFALVIIGGLVSSTILTLYVLPALYLWLMPGTARRHKASQSPSLVSGGS